MFVVKLVGCQLTLYFFDFFTKKSDSMTGRYQFRLLHREIYAPSLDEYS